MLGMLTKSDVIDNLATHGWPQRATPTVVCYH